MRALASLARLSIRARLAIVYTTVLFLTLLLFGAAVGWLLHHRATGHIEDAVDRRLQGLEAFLRRETTPDQAWRIPEEMVEYAFTQPEGHLLEVRDEAGRVLLASEPVTSPAIVRERTFELYGRRYDARGAGSLILVEQGLADLITLLWISVPILLVISAASGYWLSRRAMAPVDEMTRTARSIGVTDLGGRLPVPPTGDELARLAGAWNEMLARLEESVSRVQQFTADAAHELRTPLSALRTTAELSLRKERAPGEYREALEQIVGISARMATLVDALLALARDDAGRRPASAPASGEASGAAPGERPGQVSARMPGRAPVDLSRIVRTAVDDVRALVEAKGLTLAVDLAAAPAMLDGDPADLRRLSATLIENAIRYTPAGGRITVAVRRASEAGGLVLEVADTGCGIDAEHLPRIFDRFYRADPSRDRQSGGYGLGLAMARQVARRHRGEIDVSSEPGRGSRFRVVLGGAAAPPAATAGPPETPSAASLASL